jgi:hypothetical protein
MIELATVFLSPGNKARLGAWIALPPQRRFGTSEISLQPDISLAGQAGENDATQRLYRNIQHPG